MAAQQRLLLLLAVVLSASVVHAAAAASSNWTVYDILDQNRLPRGFLPQGVQSYEVHVGGALDVTLPGDCTVSVTADGKTHRFRYARRVGGVLINSSITRAYGIKMELASAWFDVGEMRSNGGRVKVDLPESTQWFPVSAFAQSPRCN